MKNTQKTTKKEKNILKKFNTILLILSCVLSLVFSFFYYQNKLNISYNDARSHLDIGKRVVDGLQPGLAQLGSVWLPLPHILMTITIWNDFMWHSGLAGTIFSMLSYVGIVFFILKFLNQLEVDIWGKIAAFGIFAFNPNILYLQSTPMTELLLLLTMLAGVYYFFLWLKNNSNIILIKSALWIMLSTLIRYDGWFLFIWATLILTVYSFRNRNWKITEGRIFLFASVAGFGILLWFIWNYIIFNNTLYFMFGPYSAHSQQETFAQEGLLSTKGNLLLSIKTYLYAIILNSGKYASFLGILGALLLAVNVRKKPISLYVLLLLLTPIIFNILALYLGHSILFIPDFNGMKDWFNIRYGVMAIPSLAIFGGFLLGKINGNWLKLILLLLLFLNLTINLTKEPVTVADAKFGKSQKNISAVAEWLHENTKNNDGLILISAASHDSIIFSSNLPMRKFIHEGVNLIWPKATNNPEKWARWIVLMPEKARKSDFLWQAINKKDKLRHYHPVATFPSITIFQLDDSFFKKIKDKTNQIYHDKE